MHGYRVLSAQSNAEALLILDKKPADAIVIDHLRTAHSLTLAREARRRLPSIAIVLLSQPGERLPGEAAGDVSAVVGKGRRASDLLQAVQRLIGPGDERPEIPRSRILQAGVKQARRARSVIRRNTEFLRTHRPPT